MIGIGRDDLAVGIEDLHRQPHPQLRRAIERHLDVGFERLGLSSIVVMHRRRRDAIAFPHGDVADDAGLRRRRPGSTASWTRPSRTCASSAARRASAVRREFCACRTPSG